MWYLSSVSLRQNYAIFSKARCFHSGSRASQLNNDNLVAKSYIASEAEDAVRSRWKSKEFSNNKLNSVHFNEDNVFRMILPPPNVTGKLHIGHALTVAIQDSIVRWKLMTGSSVKWIPGFDHAGIATQSVVTRRLQTNKAQIAKDSEGVVVKENPDVLLEKLNEFAEANISHISGQLEKIGALLDWNSLYYTMNKKHGSVVEEAFITLFESGLIQRGDGMVNWSCALQSSVADVECVSAPFEGKITLRVPDHKQVAEFGRLYFIKYKVVNSDSSIVVATSRPETIFGDVAVAVNPLDRRFTNFIGSRVINPVDGRPMPIIADNRVKVDFGSGALKVTPAHDKTDFAIGLDHSLEMRNILREDGRLNEKCGKFSGWERFVVRKVVVKQLSESGAISDIQDYKGSVELCSRTGDVIEPKILPHWFFQTKGLTDKIISFIESKELRVQPEYQKLILLHKLASPLNWCLSRQIQWGHAIPAYYHINHPSDWVAAFDKTDAKKKLERKLSIDVNYGDICQDKDVLDTWFSSALLPLAVSGWPEIDAQQYKELSLMETGSDILLFWVWRMVLLNLALLDRLPFRDVVLHGVITDPYGRKMSKSRGNVIDPMHIIEGQTFDAMMQETEVSYQNGDLDKNEYKLRLAGLKKDYPKGFPMCGADALRFALLSQDINKQDIKLDVVYLENCKRFMNKIWQAMRFYFAHADKGIHHPTEIAKPDIRLTNTLPDLWILSCLYEFNVIMEENIPLCRFHVCMDAIREFFYQQFCDVYIELIKQELSDGVNAETRIHVMRYVFGTGLQLIHPFLPFVSEQMWFHITGNNQGLLRDAEFPKSNEFSEFRNNYLRHTMSKALKITTEIRSLRTKVGASNKEKLQVFAELNPKDPSIDQVAPAIQTLTNTHLLLEFPMRTSRPNLVTHTLELDHGATCRLSTMKTDSAEHSIIPRVDPVKIVKLKAKYEKLVEKLNNPAFLKFADKVTKEELKKKIEIIKTQLDEITQSSTKRS